MDTTVVMKRIGALAVIILSGWFLVSSFLPGTESRQQSMLLLHQANRLFARGEFDQAEDLARKVTTLNPAGSAAWRLAAECAIARGAHGLALKDLSHIQKADAADWLFGRRIAANLLHHHLFRLGEAESAYREVLSVAPDDIFANDGMARLLGVCGRRSEAIPHVLRLIRAGETTDLLMLLARPSGSLNDPRLLQVAVEADAKDSNPLIGEAVAAELAEDPDEAIRKLKEAAALKPLPGEVFGRFGRLLLAEDRFDDLEQWCGQLTSHTPSADGWLVRAELAIRGGDRTGAIRCYWEAALLQAESSEAMSNLAQHLIATGHADLAKPFLEQIRRLNQLRDQQQLVIMSKGDPDFDQFLAMVKGYEAVGRLWEALAWGRLALQLDADSVELNAVLKNLSAKEETLELKLTADEFSPAAQIDLSEYPIPATTSLSSAEPSGSISRNIAFKLNRAEVGFDFRYFNGSDNATRRMYELAGGGVAVIDFNNDLSPDLFCTQGVPWNSKDANSGAYVDQLFRNHNGTKFEAISPELAAPRESGFGQGASVGDVNGDGFADLYIANTGKNELLLNNGDGTFSDASSSLPDRGAEWTTSCLIADLNTDGWPDIYDVNYLAGEDIFDRVCPEAGGDRIMCLPYDFEAAPDRLWLNDGAGGFTEQSSSQLSPPPTSGKGLGIVAARLGGHGLSVFVANDTTANFFYTKASVDDLILTEMAGPRGLAFNGEGKAEACMGIAVADCNQDGLFDLHVTNFLHESNTLFRQTGDQFFEDRTRQVGLQKPTLSVLGFGTQFLDANLDGRTELFVANGYIQDLTAYATPYQMQPQMFEWTGQQFRPLSDRQLGPWSSVPVVGRAAARLDWNCDGYPDLVVSTLDTHSFLLTNTAAAELNRFLSLSLIATDSARDAIGTTVVVTIDGREYFHQLTAGDGFQCSNERRLLIGCGTSQVIERVVILWPSGKVQTHKNVSTNRRVVAVEGCEIQEVP